MAFPNPFCRLVGFAPPAQWKSFCADEANARTPPQACRTENPKAKPAEKAPNQEAQTRKTDPFGG